MKRLIFALLLAASLPALSYADQAFQTPPMKDTVSDYAGVVEPRAGENVRTMADQLRQVTAVNYKVLVISQLPPGVKIGDYGRQVYGQWKVGALLVISIIDRQVRLITGKEVDRVISDRSREQAEWDVLAILSRGLFSQGVEIGTIEITNKILAGWYASHRQPRFAIDWQAASLFMFALFAVSLVTTLVTGSDFMMGFSIFVGGFYGFLFLNIVGMILFGLLGFLLTCKAGQNSRKNGEEQAVEGKKT